jgi:hypothetical protein
MALRDELRDIGQDSVKQAIPFLVGGATAGFIAWLKKMPMRMEVRQLRRQKRRAARQARKAAR